MKSIKRMFAFMLSAAMVLMMAIPAFAASSYTITVTNAAAGATYSAYKIFDATSSGDAVSYTIPSGSDIESAEVTIGENSTMKFSDIFTTTKNGGLTYVTVKQSVNETAVTTWLKNYVGSQSATAAASVTNVNNADTVELDVSEQGYYYVTTATGSAVTITTVTGSATVIDKNDRTPSIDPDNGKQVATSKDGTYGNVATMNVGDTAYFKITFKATNYVVKNGESTQITEYTVIDTPDGFSIAQDSVAVKVGDTILKNTQDRTLYSATVDSTSGVLTVVIDWDDADNHTIYNATETVEVTYTANLTNENLAAASSNKAEIKYNTTTLTDTPEVTVYNYTVAIDKYAANANNVNDNSVKLSGAKFVLYKTEGEDEDAKNLYYKVNDATGAVTWTTTQSEATVVTTNNDGAANFKGLAAGTYYLLETEAPAGYNLLGTATTVTLAEITGVLNGTDSLTNTASVANSSGSQLPTTGGTGTTVLYTIGIILVLGAGILLVVRRRMSVER